MFEEYAVVTLKKDMPLKNVKAGDRGVIVMIYESSPKAYEVEVFSENGDTVALLTLKKEDIERSP